MSGDADRAARRARRLLRPAPAALLSSGLARYGEEFAQLLVDDFAERPRSARRTADVVASNLQTLAEISVDKNSTVVFPAPADEHDHRTGHILGTGDQDRGRHARGAGTVPAAPNGQPVS